MSTETTTLILCVAALVLPPVSLTLVAFWLRSRFRQMDRLDEEERNRGRWDAATVSAFFVRPSTGKIKRPCPVDEKALARRLQEHLKKEEARVAEFVLEPSIERLYRDARTA